MDSYCPDCSKVGLKTPVAYLDVRPDIKLELCKYHWIKWDRKERAKSGGLLAQRGIIGCGTGSASYSITHDESMVTGPEPPFEQRVLMDVIE